MTQNDKLAELQTTLSEETAATLRDVLTDSEEWHEVKWKEVLLQIVSRVSSLVFLGPELGRNAALLDIITQYSNKTTTAARVLKRWPRSLVPYVHWFLPEMKELRNILEEANRIISPILQKRREQKAANGNVKFQDALGWFEEIAEEKGISYDAACYQIGLSVAAVLTSTDITCQNILDMCRNPHYVEPLREEIRAVLGNGEWKSTTLHNLKLMDSALKETLRLKPNAIGK